MSDDEDLLARMTLEEKLGQLTMAAGTLAVTGPVAGGDLEADVRAGRVGSLLNLWGAKEVAAIQDVAIRESRLGVPLLVGFDVLHGHRTIFPIPLAEACAFDPSLWARTAAAAAREAAADGVSMAFAPMIDVARDPRWGRIAEGAGEDPFVASEFARAKIAGFQGADLAAPFAVAAVAKHFCAYGAAQGGRDYASADVSDRALREVYLPPFAAAIEAGCAALMPAFMDLAGVPMIAHRVLLRGWLREERGFDGVIVSDYNALAELIAHGVAADAVEAAALALRAGIDVDMMSFAFRDGLPRALERGVVEIAEIDAAALRVLRLKRRLGLFERPAKGVGFREGEAEAAAEAKRLAREAARRSIVLMTNNGRLPLAAPRIVALIGPLADASEEMDGPWAGAGARAAAVSIREGLCDALPESEICLAGGAFRDDADGHAAALRLCDGADVVILCLGESAEMSGEAASRADLGLPGRQRELAERTLDLCRERGAPVVALLTCGRPLAVPWLFDRADAVLATWFLGEAAGDAVADVLTGRCDAVGRLPVSWPRAVGQIPLCYAERPTGRPFAPDAHYSSRYLDCPNAPQFPFGHGLSYARFAIEGLECDLAAFGPEDTLEFSGRIRNEGPRDGETTLFLFVRDPLACVARPLLELKRFARIALRAGERGTARFRLPAAELAFPGLDLKPLFEPGAFEFSVRFSAGAQEGATLRLQAYAGAAKSSSRPCGKS